MTMLVVVVMLALPVLGLGIALTSDAQNLAGAIADGKHGEWIADGFNSTLGQKMLQAAYPSNTTEQRNATVLNITHQLEDFAIEQLAVLGKQIAASAGEFMVAMVVILFVVYYVLIDGHKLVSYLKRASPIPSKQMDYLLKEAHNGMRAVFAGQILTSSIQGALGGVGFLIAGVPGAIVWAAVMAVLSLLPVVGAFLVWVPAMIFLFFQWSSGEVALWKPVFLLVWGVIVVSQVDNFIRPRLIGDRANIHPIFVLIGVLGGVAAFGFIGLFLGPLIVGITLSVLRVWESDYLDPAVGAQDPTARHRVGGRATLAQDMTEIRPASTSPEPVAMPDHWADATAVDEKMTAAEHGGRRKRRLLGLGPDDAVDPGDDGDENGPSDEPDK
jgi:predicted PurR-regulated permease PerM